MVAGATIEEQILDELVTTLGAISTTSSPAYNTDVARVYRDAVEIEELPELPAIVILHEGTEQEDDRLGLIVVEMRLGLVGVLSPDDTDVMQKIHHLGSDISSTLRQDPTRGGLAFKTHVSNFEAYPSSPTFKVVVGRSDCTVTFRHAFGDPTQAL